jgi:hypothetical protein
VIPFFEVDWTVIGEYHYCYRVIFSAAMRRECYDY